MMLIVPKSYTTVSDSLWRLLDRLTRQKRDNMARHAAQTRLRVEMHSISRRGPAGDWMMLSIASAPPQTNRRTTRKTNSVKMPKATQDIIILGPLTEAFGISSILITHQYLGGWLNKEEIDIHVCHRIIPIQAKTSLQKAEQPCDSIWSGQLKTSQSLL
jgi:hypothetical protein